MEMRHAFAAVRAVVDHQAETLAEAGPRRFLFGDQKEMSEQCSLIIGGFADAGDGVPRNDEQVGGGLWIDIPQHGASVILEDDFGGNLARHDALKEREFGHDQKSLGD